MFCQVCGCSVLLRGVLFSCTGGGFVTFLLAAQVLDMPSEIGIFGRFVTFLLLFVFRKLLNIKECYFVTSVTSFFLPSYVWFLQKVGKTGGVGTKSGRP